MIICFSRILSIFVQAFSNIYPILSCTSLLVARTFTYNNQSRVMNKSNLHKLKLTYQEYRKMGKTISNSTIGKYVVYNEIGRGAFGAVYKGMNDETKKMVAIKVLDLEAVELDPSEKVRQIRRRLCRTESQLMMLCNSQNVIKCYDVYENKSLKIMIIEFCNGGTLQDEIQMKIRIPEKEAILVLKQVINGIAELHSHKIIHRDLKAQNILSHNGVYKIADMGFSKIVEDNQIKQTTLGTITTMAPEVMKRMPYGLKADIWSIGVIFFQMIFGQVPYRSTNANQMYEEIRSKKILERETFTFNNYTASAQVTRFLKDVMVVDSVKRLGWKELVSHPLFKQNQQKNRLGNQFRISLNLVAPAQAEEHENQISSTVENLLVKFQQSNLDNHPQELIRLTQAEANIKMKELKAVDDAIFEWAQATHLQCLKTQLIYNEIIEKIQISQLLDFSQRQVVELMYLLCTRCKNNISVINDKLKKENKQQMFIAQNLYQTVKQLYERIEINWKKYSNLLTNVENKVSSIISDKFSKIFNRKSIEEKDKFLVGIESMYYTKEEQINFTDKEYITPLMSEFNQSNTALTKRVKNYLSHYVEINNIRLTDLNKRTFQEYVEMILQ